jgi:hypothetical protein
MKIVRAIVINDSRSQPICLISKVDYSPLERESYAARLPSGELVSHNRLDLLFTHLARRAKKGDL